MNITADQDARAQYQLRCIFPAAFALLPDEMDSPEARALLIGIGLQESRYQHRRQIKGPAHGWYQFEKHGGVRGVLAHPETTHHAALACTELCYAPDVAVCYEAIVDNDVLATVFARLLLWTLPWALPSRTQPDRAWRSYLAAWRPGKPHRESFDPFFDHAWGLL